MIGRLLVTQSSHSYVELIRRLQEQIANNRQLYTLIAIVAIAAGFSSGNLEFVRGQSVGIFVAAYLIAYILAVRASRGHIICLYIFYKDEYPAWDLGRLGNGMFIFAILYAVGLMIRL